MCTKIVYRYSGLNHLIEIYLFYASIFFCYDILSHILALNWMHTKYFAHFWGTHKMLKQIIEWRRYSHVFSSKTHCIVTESIFLYCMSKKSCPSFIIYSQCKNWTRFLVHSVYSQDVVFSLCLVYRVYPGTTLPSSVTTPYCAVILYNCKLLLCLLYVQEDLTIF